MKIPKNLFIFQLYSKSNPKNKVEDNMLIKNKCFSLILLSISIICSIECAAQEINESISQVKHNSFRVYTELDADPGIAIDGNYGGVPNYIFNFRDLSSLSILGCGILEIPYKKISEFNNLYKLTIKRNAYAINFQEICENLKNSQSLRYLTLIQDSITTIPTNINLLNTINSLDLSNNYIKTVPREVFEMENLRKLVLSNNQIETLGTQSKPNHAITFLVLDSMDFTKIPKGVEDLQGLTYLSLNGNPQLNLEDVCDLIEKLPNLRHIAVEIEKVDSIPKRLINFKTGGATYFNYLQNQFSAAY